MSREVNVGFILALLSRTFDLKKSPPFVEEMSVKWLEISPRSSGLVLRGEINVTKNCAHCNWGLASMSEKVNVGPIALLGPFDIKESPPVC